MSRGRIGHFYIEDTCIGCGACEHACPGKVDAVYKLEDDFMGRFAIVLEDCIDCGLCVGECPVAAIFSEYDLPAEWAGFVKKNAAYYRDGHG